VHPVAPQLLLLASQQVPTASSVQKVVDTNELLLQKHFPLLKVAQQVHVFVLGGFGCGDGG
jgi:hypothetical protein